MKKFTGLILISLFFVISCGSDNTDYSKIFVGKWKINEDCAFGGHNGVLTYDKNGKMSMLLKHEHLPEMNTSYSGSYEITKERGINFIIGYKGTVIHNTGKGSDVKAGDLIKKYFKFSDNKLTLKNHDSFWDITLEWERVN